MKRFNVILLIVAFIIAGVSIFPLSVDAAGLELQGFSYFSPGTLAYYGEAIFPYPMQFPNSDLPLVEFCVTKVSDIFYQVWGYSSNVYYKNVNGRYWLVSDSDITIFRSLSLMVDVGSYDAYFYNAGDYLDAPVESIIYSTFDILDAGGNVVFEKSSSPDIIYDYEAYSFLGDTTGVSSFVYNDVTYYELPVSALDAGCKFLTLELTDSANLIGNYRWTTRYEVPEFLEVEFFADDIPQACATIAFSGIYFDLDAGAVTYLSLIPYDPVSILVGLDDPVLAYPGSSVQFVADVSVIGDISSDITWSVEDAFSADTVIDTTGLLTIGADETASSVKVIATSVAYPDVSGSYVLDIFYPTSEVQVSPKETFLNFGSKERSVEYELLLPDGSPFLADVEWSVVPNADATDYFSIDENGKLTVLGGAPVGSVAIVRWKYAFSEAWDTSGSYATIKITSTEEGIYDQLTPTPEQSDKADQLEDAIGDAADKLENNNSHLGSLTPSRPQLNTNLELDQENLLAFSPLVTNIWSINGLTRMILVVITVATVAYAFFGKRDG